jgi:Lipid A 3-O-deacylase (PagL)
MNLLINVRIFILLTVVLATSCYGYGQENSKQTLLDSLNKAREKDLGAFNLYVTKTKLELIGGAFSNRSNQGFQPFTFTYHVYLPFQLELNRVNEKAGDKLIKINMPLIVHHSKYGNYALGLGNRFSFLVYKRLYLSYQIGLVWCEVVKKDTDDGFTKMGLNFHHEFNLSYGITKRIALSANLIHISNGGLFKNVKNNQDVLGIGVSYNFNSY